MLAGTLAYAVAEAVRPRQGPARLLDWDEIRRLARARVRGGGTLSKTQRETLAAEYNRLAQKVEPHLLRAVGGLPAGVGLPPFDAIDRKGWVDLNIGILRRAMEPIMDTASRLPNSRIVDFGRAGMDRYVAYVLAFLARRVLGQFDPQLAAQELIDDPEIAGELYLVEPNIASWQAEANLDGEELRRWLILHEMTHAWQFAAHPWLRRHLNGMLQEVIGLATQGKRDPWSQLVSMTVGLPKQWLVVRRMQATMTLIEGYSNLVMNLVGRDLLPGFDRLEAAYRRRSAHKSPLEVAFWKLTGLDLKLQQYARGEAFARKVYDAHGMEVLNLAWRGPESLPRLEELDHPEDWYSRVAEKPAGRSRA